MHALVYALFLVFHDCTMSTSICLHPSFFPLNFHSMWSPMCPLTFFIFFFFILQLLVIFPNSFQNISFSSGKKWSIFAIQIYYFLFSLKDCQLEFDSVAYSPNKLASKYLHTVKNRSWKLNKEITCSRCKLMLRCTFRTLAINWWNPFGSFVLLTKSDCYCLYVSNLVVFLLPSRPNLKCRSFYQ